MAIPTFTIIPDARLEPDAPVRSVDALALRDNPLAIAQADDANPTPQVATAGIEDAAVTIAKLQNFFVSYGTDVSGVDPLDLTIIPVTTHDFRDRYIQVTGSLGVWSAANVVRKIPGGADDDDINSQTLVNSKASINCDFFYSRNGSASRATLPYLTFDDVNGNVYRIWVSDGTVGTAGDLMLSVNQALATKSLSWNLMIQTSDDVGEY